MEVRFAMVLVVDEEGLRPRLSRRACLLRWSLLEMGESLRGAGSSSTCWVLVLRFLWELVLDNRDLSDVEESDDVET